jgi:hypothetical protein
MISGKTYAFVLRSYIASDIRREQLVNTSINFGLCLVLKLFFFKLRLLLGYLTKQRRVPADNRRGIAAIAVIKGRMSKKNFMIADNDSLIEADAIGVISSQCGLCSRFYRRGLLDGSVRFLEILHLLNCIN